MYILDNFIQDQVLLEEIQHDKEFFGPNGDFMWWDGWWNSSANTLKKRLIEYIWRYNSPTETINNKWDLNIGQVFMEMVFLILI